MSLRVRTQGSLSDGLDWYFYKGTKYNLSNKEYLKVGETKRTTDVVTPKFRSRVERGEIINNYFESWRINRSQALVGPAFYQTSIPANTWDYAHAYWPVPSSYISEWGVNFAESFSEACTEARARVATPDVDGLVETAEAKQTMELFRKRTWNLNEALRRERNYARKRGQGNVIAAGRLFRDNWLKYRYGIMPFVRLMHDALVVGPRIVPRRETARGSGPIVAGSEILTTTTSSDSNFSETWTVTRSWSVSTRAGILYEYDNFRNRWGFSLADVPAAIWEATPWSFVVDWFLNTGDFIRALTPKLGISELAAWSGFHSEVRLAATRTGYATGSGRTLTRAPSGACLTLIEGKVRRPNCPAPKLYVKDNALRSIATSQRVIDAFALSSQLLFR